MTAATRKEKLLEKYMGRTVHSDLNSQISGKNLSEFSIKFEGLSDKYSHTEIPDVDDGRDFQGGTFICKEDNGEAHRMSLMGPQAMDIQRSKSANNNVQSLKTGFFKEEFQKAFPNGNKDNRL